MEDGGQEKIKLAGCETKLSSWFALKTRKSGKRGSTTEDWNQVTVSHCQNSFLHSICVDST